MKVFVAPKLVKANPGLALWVQRVRSAKSWWDAMRLVRNKMKLSQAKEMLLILGVPPGCSDPHKRFLELVTDSDGQRHGKIMVGGSIKIGRKCRPYSAPLNQYGRSIPHDFWKMSRMGS